MVTTRSRTLDKRVAQTGYMYLAGSPPFEQYYSWASGTRKECSDVVGNRKSANAFRLVSRTEHRPGVDGILTDPNGKILRKLENRPVDGWCTADYGGSYFPGLTAQEINSLAWKTAAETNPVRPHMNLVAFVGELRELPETVLGWGRSLLRDAAKFNLSWRWCVRPMTQDIAKLFDFTRAVSQRFRWLKRLRSGDRTLRRRVFIRRNVVNGPSRMVFVNTSGCRIYGQETASYTEQVWGSASWKLSSLPAELERRMYDDNYLLKTAGRWAYGLTSAGAALAAWELLPWSWLIDWFVGVGDMLAATHNELPITYKDVCIMRTLSGRKEISILHGPQTDTWVRLRGPVMSEASLKERHAASPTVSFIPTIPLINAGRLSVLASLAVLKSKRSFRLR